MNCDFSYLRINNVVYVKSQKADKECVSYSPNLKVHQLIFELSGHYDTFLGNSKISATPDSVRFYPKGNFDSYTVFFEENTKCINICFESDVPLLDTPGILCQNAPKLRKLFWQMFFIWSRKDSGYYNECLSVMYKILSELEKKLYLPEKQFEQIKPAIDYINENFLLSKITTEELVSVCGISYTHLKNLFKKKYGLSPQKYITMLKMNYACSLLKFGVYNITKVSEMCGYDDMNFFSRRFKEIFNVSPTQYIKSINKNQ